MPHFQKSFIPACDILLKVLHMQSFWAGFFSLPKLVPGNCSYQSCFIWTLLVWSNVVFLPMKSALCDEENFFLLTFRQLCCKSQACGTAQLLVAWVWEKMRTEDLLKLRTSAVDAHRLFHTQLLIYKTPWLDMFLW